MESNTIIKASEARRQAENNSLTVEKVMEVINNDINNGRDESAFIGMIVLDKLKNELFNLGYSLRIAKGHCGENIFIVSW